MEWDWDRVTIRIHLAIIPGCLSNGSGRAARPVDTGILEHSAVLLVNKLESWFDLVSVHVVAICDLLSNTGDLIMGRGLLSRLGLFNWIRPNWVWTQVMNEPAQSGKCCI